jgi:uncharacterized membrane protein
MDALTRPYVWLLVIHVGAVIVGLGPSFIYARIGKAGAQEPAHALFALRLNRWLSTRWTHPLATVVLLSGFALIWITGYPVMQTPWLLLSIVLYGASYVYATFVNTRDLDAILRIVEQGPPPSQPPEVQAELLRLRRRVRYGGLFMRGVVLIVLVLMVAKPVF